ncbi:MAG: carboxypeptidase-like regulatory domain-containing protein [Hymenobacter sp.]
MRFTVSLLLLGLLLTGRLALAQRITLSGQVVEATSGEPVPFASIFVPRTSTGITADMDGKFKLIVDGAPDSLAASALGFLTLRQKLTTEPQQAVLFRMRKGGGVALAEVMISSRQPENPAFRILREVQKHKPENERSALNSADYDSYNRIEVSLTELPTAMAKRKVVKDIRALAVRQGAAAAADPDAPLPLFASEVGSRVYSEATARPCAAARTSSTSRCAARAPARARCCRQMLGSNFQNFDFYPNWQNILGKDFISPISAEGGRAYLRLRAAGLGAGGPGPVLQADAWPRAAAHDLALAGHHLDYEGRLRPAPRRPGGQRRTPTSTS